MRVQFVGKPTSHWRTVLKRDSKRVGFGDSFKVYKGRYPKLQGKGLVTGAAAVLIPIVKSVGSAIAVDAIRDAIKKKGGKVTIGASPQLSNDLQDLNPSPLRKTVKEKPKKKNNRSRKNDVFD